jgi:hypothetical protein
LRYLFKLSSLSFVFISSCHQTFLSTRIPLFKPSCLQMFMSPNITSSGVPIYKYSCHPACKSSCQTLLSTLPVWNFSIPKSSCFQDLLFSSPSAFKSLW